MPDIHARYIGNVPEFYDRHLGPVMFDAYAALLAERVVVSPPASVLEIACGTGRFTRQLRQRLAPAVRVVATDLNRPMIDLARSRLLQEAIEWDQADATALPFPNASFAAVVCAFGLMFFPNKSVAMREARRVLSEGGLLAFSVWGSLKDNPYARLADQLVREFLPVDPPDFFRVPFGYHDTDVLRGLLRTSGFDYTKFDWITLPLHGVSARALAAGLVQGYPVCHAISERGVSVEAVVDALAAALANHGGEAPFRSTMRALIVTARAV